MIQMDRETLMMIATIVAIAGVIFLFKEMNKAKQDVESLKNFSAHLVHRLSGSEPQTQSVKDDDEEAELEKGAEEKKEE